MADYLILTRDPDGAPRIVTIVGDHPASAEGAEQAVQTVDLDPGDYFPVRIDNAPCVRLVQPPPVAEVVEGVHLSGAAAAAASAGLEAAVEARQRRELADLAAEPAMTPEPEPAEEPPVEPESMDPEPPEAPAGEEE